MRGIQYTCAARFLIPLLSIHSFAHISFPGGTFTGVALACTWKVAAPCHRHLSRRDESPKPGGKCITIDVLKCTVYSIPVRLVFSYPSYQSIHLHISAFPEGSASRQMAGNMQYTIYNIHKLPLPIYSFAQIRFSGRGTASHPVLTHSLSACILLLFDKAMGLCLLGNAKRKGVIYEEG